MSFTFLIKKSACVLINDKALFPCSVSKDFAPSDDPYPTGRASIALWNILRASIEYAASKTVTIVPLLPSNLSTKVPAFSS